MISLTNKISNADYYFSFLKILNTNSKLDLISKLSESLKMVEPAVTVAEKPLQSLFGAYKSKETSEEIIARLRDSKNFSREIELL